MVSLIDNEIQSTFIKMVTQHNNVIKLGDRVQKLGTTSRNIYFFILFYLINLKSNVKFSTRLSQKTKCLSLQTENQLKILYYI